MLKIVEKPELPEEIFQAEATPQLLAQAVRIFLANQRQGTQSAKTRAEVERTRKKLYKQKGTGGARHGDRKAPIFVGGGVAFAPKPRDYSLSFPQRMKKRALFGALSAQVKNKNLSVVSGLEKLSGKTAELAKFLTGLNGEQKPLLVVTDIPRENVRRAAQNIPGVTVNYINRLYPYEVLKAGKVLFMEEAVSALRGPAQIKNTKKIVSKTRTKNSPIKLDKNIQTKKTVEPRPVKVKKVSLKK